MRGFNRQGMGMGMRLQGQRRAQNGSAATEARGFGAFGIGRGLMCRRNIYGRGQGASAAGASSLQMLKDEAQRLKMVLQDIERQIDSQEQP